MINSATLKKKGFKHYNKSWLIDSFIEEEIGLCSLNRGLCGFADAAVTDVVPLAGGDQSLHDALLLLLQASRAVLDLQVPLDAVLNGGGPRAEEIRCDADVGADLDVRGVMAGVQSSTVLHDSVQGIQDFLLAWSYSL